MRCRRGRGWRRTRQALQVADLANGDDGDRRQSLRPALTTVVVPFNDIAALETALATGEIACVLAEPALTNIGIILPDPGFHAALRDLTRRYDTLLVIDETHTICVGPGGATQSWQLDPDFVVIGKTIGGGMPAAAYGCSAAIAVRLDRLLDDAEPIDNQFGIRPAS